MGNELYTEKDSLYDNLPDMEILELLTNINKEDRKVPEAVGKALPQVEALIKKVIETFINPGRMFYIGAGSSGRLGVIDASECVNTFGISTEMIIAIIAGGDKAIRSTIRGAEDNKTQGFLDLLTYKVSPQDIVIGIAASGQTPYVAQALKTCQEKHIPTGCIVCNPKSIIAKYADFPVEVIVGPEFITGSTRMKAGSAQKFILNMISTCTMIKLGKVEGNKMTHMFLTTEKLIDRGINIIMKKTGLNFDKSKDLLAKNDYNIAVALEEFRKMP